jgi:mediator of replication checkpoint protein 1
MSSPSTPRSTRSASPAGGSPNIITPGQKIKALMAEFDSDSEDDTRIAKSTTAVSKLNLRDSGSAKTSEHAPSHDSDSESENNVARPKGRMAARMQGNESYSPESKDNSAFARVSKALRSEKERAQKPEQTELEPTSHESSDEDLPTAGPRRKNKARSNSPQSETSQTRPRAESPLFVSSPAEPGAQSDDDTTEKPKANARFLSLVAQKRKEREDREKAEAEKKAARRAQMEHFSSEVLSGEESGADDPVTAHKLSQEARQPRKASKKALDEMRQETQRMSRNMQLAHQAKTKKKITKESLFAKFNFMQPDAPIEQPAANSSSTNNSQKSQGEVRTQNKDTPHTSPSRPSDPIESTVDSEDAQVDVDMVLDDEDLPDPNNLLTQEGRAATLKAEVPKDASPSQAGHAKPIQFSRPDTGRPFRVRISRQQIAERQKKQDSDEDSDDELEIVTSPGKCRRLAAFENLPTRRMQEDAAMTKLKALAHLTSPSKIGASMNAAELSASLLRRARQQAAKERKDRIEELKAKGVVIETAEERAAMEDDMENLVEKARKEADDIARLERAAKKKKNDNVDDDDEDGDYNLSGSDEEGYGEGDDEDEEEKNDSINGGDFVEREADDDDDDLSEGVRSDAEEVPSARRKRRTRVISDDEDEDQAQPPSTPVRAPSHNPQSTERPKFPGMGTPGDVSLGLTQAFASTLDNNGVSQPLSSTMPFSLPDPGRTVPHLRKEESEILVPDSQPQEKDPMDGYTQSITRVSESPAPYAFSEFSQSQLPDPTQDEGFVFSPFDPARRFRDTPPISTVDTVLVGQTQSPVADRKRRMLRRGRATELPQVDENEDEFEINANAFNVMKKTRTAKKQAVEYNKKTSRAKDIVDEAAEESEDEYAGLGGHSDESDGEENAIDRQMINDNSGEVVDEKQLAALNAYGCHVSFE